MWQTNHLAVAGIGCQDVGSHGTDILCQTHHQFLSDGVDGGVGNLRKLLTEIVEEYLGAVADNSQRRIIAHRSHRLLTGCCHRDDGFVNVFLSVAELYEFAFEVLYRIFYVATALQFLQLDTVGAQPFAIGVSLGQLLLDLAIVVYLAFLGIYEQNLSGLQTSLADHITWFEVHYTNLGGNNYHTVLGDGVTTGAQTVSVEHTAGKTTVREQQSSRTVPRLHQDRMILIERLQVFRDGILVVETLRHQNSHRLW